VKEFFDYAIAEIYFNNTDWPGNNLKYWRPKTIKGKWRWILFDTDFGFGLYNETDYQNNTLAFALAENGPDWPNPPWSTFLLRKMLENESLKTQFINYFADHLNITFKNQRVHEIISAKKNIILSEIPKHLSRWHKSLSVWQMSVNRLNTFARFRVAYMRQHLSQHFNLSAMSLVNINLTDSTMGKIEINNHLSATADFSGYYFPEIPIEIKAIPNPGYRFTGWTGGYNSNNEQITFYPYGNIDITAHFEKAEGLDISIVINEINYNSHDDYDSGDWIEMYNANYKDIDCSAWVFKDENDSHQFVFPENTIITADSFLVLVNDSVKFTTMFPAATNFIGETGFGLSGSGELLRLYNEDGVLVDSLVYDDAWPWPIEADGNGASLELIDPLKDNSIAENWAASLGHGSPGQQNSVRTAIQEKEKSVLPQEFTLKQNYPNPFSSNGGSAAGGNPRTVIKYQLPASGSVRLSVYNNLGQLVRTLVDSKQQAGTYSVQFNAEHLASGVYFYVIAFGNQNTIIRKMIIMR